jgi:acetyltransferase-like isoleucine patch superfamily enzyme
MNIRPRVIVGSLVAFAYNRMVGRFPSRKLRQAFLMIWLDRLGTGTAVQSECKFLNGRGIRLGRRNVINWGCVLDGRRYQISTGDDVSIGPEATILTLGHDPQSPGFCDRGDCVIIGDRVWIGYRAIILPGISIGDGAVVGAGSVVTRDVAPYSIVAGNPARVVGERARDLSYELDYHPWLA